MEPMSQNWQKSSKLCRCCLTKDCDKDISVEYIVSGQKEIYEDMLNYTFGLNISPDGNYSSQFNRFICEECIMRLRDAFKFKEMILKSDEYLQNLLETDYVHTDKTNLDLKLVEIKLETAQDENNTMDDEIDHQSDDNKFDDDDEILANFKTELSKSENIDVTRKRRKRSIQNAKLRKKAKVDEDCSSDKITNGGKNEKDWSKITERRGNGPLLRENSLKLIENSTICVFQWNKSRYRCFCCNEPFSDMTLLRDHTNKKHTIENIEKKIILQQNRLVKVEISVFYCKLCGDQLNSLDNLRKHLITHNIKFELQDDLLVPFKISAGTLQCQICEENFNMFRHLNIHMNKHFQKQVCHICGAGFSNLVFLNLHKSRSHRPLSCKECNLDFKTKIDKKQHDISEHNFKTERKLRFPCPFCDERFFQENFRVQHLVEKHGMKKPEYKCSICSKVYITRSLCNNHMKNVHLKEKNHECDVCHHFFYTKSDVSRHKVTHTGEKKFTCNLCNNLFATKDSLRRHMRRTHVGMHLINK